VEERELEDGVGIRDGDVEAGVKVEASLEYEWGVCRPARQVRRGVDD
jgi:hypothetical protein